MVQIKSLDISRLRNDEDFGYQTRVVNLAVAMLSQDVDKPVVDAYKAALTAFDAALKQAAKNSQTEAVAAADEVVDRLYTGLTLYLRSLTYHPVEATRIAAEGVLVIIDKYGKLTGLPYNQQYGVLLNSMQELTALTEETFTLLHLADWLAELSSAIARFQNARDMQTAEQLSGGLGEGYPYRSRCCLQAVRGKHQRLCHCLR